MGKVREGVENVGLGVGRGVVGKGIKMGWVGERVRKKKRRGRREEEWSRSMLIYGPFALRCCLLLLCLLLIVLF